MREVVVARIPGRVRRLREDKMSQESGRARGQDAVRSEVQ